MPDPWSDFDDRWRVDDERERRRREQRTRRRSVRRRRFVALLTVMALAGGAVYLVTSGRSATDGDAVARVFSQPTPAADTTTTTTTATTATATTASTATVPAAAAPRPSQPKARTAVQKRIAADDAIVAHFAKHSWYVRQGGKRGREMALTFDDGPGPYTAQVMKILRDTHTPATFFQIGEQIPAYASLVRQQVRDGFVLGDHTEEHVALAGKPRAEQHQQISDQIAQEVKAGAPTPTLFRPPTGVWDRTTRQLLKRKGMVAVFWTIDTEDYTMPGTQRIVNEVLSGAQPGAIVLMHDAGGNRTQTVAALPTIIKGLRAKGYKLVTVPQLLKDAPPRKKKQAPFGSGPGL